MFTGQDVKGALERLTGVGRPKPLEAAGAVRARKANRFQFRDNGVIPNNPLPLLIYRSPISLKGGFDPAAVFEEVFKSNGWSDGWRDGIYDYTHYHSRTHEVLGIARGNADVQFGGPDKKTHHVKAGDVVVIPAGVSHRRLAASEDLLVVGAYPQPGKYNEYRASEKDYAQAVKEIPKVSIPAKDPIYGADGPLTKIWR